jgi:glycine oxidase
VSPDVIVVGAGAIGTSITYHLARAGAKVMLFDRGQIGREATGASAGMIMPHHGPGTPDALDLLSRESARLYPALADELRDRTGMDIGYRRAGTLEVAFTDSEEQDLRARRGWALDHGTNVAWLDRRSALDLEPALNPAIRGGIFHGDDHQVQPLAMAQSLARAAADLGTVVREGVAIDQLRTERDRVIGVGLGQETVHASEVVIATGAWSSAWSTALGLAIPVGPVRGQMVALRTVDTALRQVISHADEYAIPKPDGTTIVGTTVEDVGFDARPTAGAIARLLQHAAVVSPRLADATFASAWAGLRPGTSDGMPIIGRPGEWRGITLATGHFREGILLAPITGELVADLLVRRRPRLPLEAFDLGRFRVRAA